MILFFTDVISSTSLVSTVVKNKKTKHRRLVLAQCQLLHHLALRLRPVYLQLQRHQFLCHQKYQKKSLMNLRIRSLNVSNNSSASITYKLPTTHLRHSYSHQHSAYIFLLFHSPSSPFYLNKIPIFTD